MMPTLSVVWKYPLAFQREQDVQIPCYAKGLTVQLQDGAPCLWALVMPSIAMMRKRVLIVGTGHSFDAGGFKYVNTFQLPDSTVWHVFLED